MNIWMIFLVGLVGYAAMVVLVCRWFRNARDWDELGEKLREEKFRLRRPTDNTKI